MSSGGSGASNNNASTPPTSPPPTRPRRSSASSLSASASSLSQPRPTPHFKPEPHPTTPNLSASQPHMPRLETFKQAPGEGPPTPSQQPRFVPIVPLGGRLRSESIDSSLPSTVKTLISLKAEPSTPGGRGRATPLRGRGRASFPHTPVTTYNPMLFSSGRGSAPKFSFESGPAKGMLSDGTQSVDSSMPADISTISQIGKKSHASPIDPNNIVHPIVLPVAEKHGEDAEKTVAAQDRKRPLMALHDDADGTLMNNDQLLFFQLPSAFPLHAQQPQLTAAAATATTAATPSASASTSASQPPGQQAPTAAPTAVVGEKAEDDKLTGGVKSNLKMEGFVGKLVIYRSGRMAMKVGDILYDVQRGTQPHFLEEVWAIDHENARCYVLGEIEQHVLVCPNMEDCLNPANSRP
ncbi:DNA-directed RNA polymerase III subunit RPC4 [Pelomyxa schiedti]|nr:DNA-directed RNA polymerase III subunit RPC4 [Pelomyxa schiedti]